jgi:hypothetical protein
MNGGSSKRSASASLRTTHSEHLFFNGTFQSVCSQLESIVRLAATASRRRRCDATLNRRRQHHEAVRPLGDDRGKLLERYAPNG